MDRLDEDLAALRALLASPSAAEDDSVRELYGELVDRYREDPAKLALLRPIGDEIRKLETEGRLPSTLVMRAPRSKDRTR